MGMKEKCDKTSAIRTSSTVVKKIEHTTNDLFAYENESVRVPEQRVRRLVRIIKLPLC